MRTEPLLHVKADVAQILRPLSAYRQFQRNWRALARMSIKAGAVEGVSVLMCNTLCPVVFWYC